MGKPFEKELERIPDIIDWANKQDVSALRLQLKLNANKPLIAIGSGGSLSTCHYASLLHQQFGSIAKIMTPLELNYAASVLRNSHLLFISASGKNTDILFGFKKSIEHEPKSIISLCMKSSNPLLDLTEKFSIATGFGYDNPIGKDGFLATNSLIAFFIILHRAYNQNIQNDYSFQEDDIGKFRLKLDTFIKGLDSDVTFITLFGGWGQPAAVDLESKFAEAALANISLSDYRNFGHGRHHWFAKRKDSSAVIAFATPTEKELASKTLSILPNSIPKLVIDTNYTGPLSTLDLLIKSFYLVNEIGKKQNIDPGKPGVPEFGSKLYNLKYYNMFKGTDTKIPLNEKNAIIRKVGLTSINDFSVTELNKWRRSYKQFMDNLTSTEFGAVIFDYDGTLCNHDYRFENSLHESVKDQLLNILKCGFVIGIVTGRGKSVREVFQNSIPKRYWNQVTIGYYNGSDISFLENNDRPDLSSNLSKSLLIINQSLKEIYGDDENVIIELRPSQITIKVKNISDWSSVRKLVLQVVHLSNLTDLDVLESSHSIDIIDQITASKLNIIAHCQALATENGKATNCLCIGDKGQWPGNDYQLLSTPFSLSVDETSLDVNSCWNIASVSIRNMDATIEYLSNLEFHSKHMIFNVK